MATSTYSLVDVSGRVTLNQTTVGNQTSPAVAVLADGSFVAAFNDGAGLIRMRQFSSALVPLGNEVVVSGGVANDQNPQLAALPDGRFVVTWSDDVGTSNTVMQRIYSSTLQPLTVQATVNPGGTTASNADVAALADGGYVVAYEVDTSTTQHDLSVQRYSAAGVALGAPVVVDASPAHATDVSVIGLTGGGYAVAYASLSDTASAESTLMRAVYENDGSVRLAPTVTDAPVPPPNYSGLRINDAPDLASRPDGGFVIAYRNTAESVGIPQLTALGLRADGSVEYSTNLGATGLFGAKPPSVAVSPAGYPLVTATLPYVDVTVGDGLLQLLTPDGATTATYAKPSTAAALGPVVAWLDQGLAVQVYSSAPTGSNPNGGDSSGASIAATLWQAERNTTGSGASETLWFDGLNDRVTLGVGDDGVFAGDGNNTVSLGAGNDVAVGGSGPDALLGGAGVDWLYGMGGADYLYGGNDTDALMGGDGNDFLFGEIGDDYAFGDAGDDAISGGAGVDRLYGGAGNDTVDGGGETDALYGEEGNDLLFGGAGDDYLFGGAGDDTLLGGAGNDLLQGDAGNDTLKGEAGNDWLIGGAGFTVFQFEGTDTGIDTIADYKPNSDALVLVGTARTSAADVKANLVQVGSDTALMLSPTSGLILLNTQVSQVSEHFILVA